MDFFREVNVVDDFVFENDVGMWGVSEMGARTVWVRHVYIGLGRG